jgi:hypothetical protein
MSSSKLPARSPPMNKSFGGSASGSSATVTMRCSYAWADVGVVDAVSSGGVVNLHLHYRNTKMLAHNGYWPKLRCAQCGNHRDQVTSTRVFRDFA